MARVRAVDAYARSRFGRSRWGRDTIDSRAVRRKSTEVDPRAGARWLAAVARGRESDARSRYSRDAGRARAAARGGLLGRRGRALFERSRRGPATRNAGLRAARRAS